MMIHLRPHHLIDIIRNIGQDRPVVPHSYGHAQHLITRQLRENIHEEIRFRIGADDLCAPCMHLKDDGNCDDVLSQFSHKVMKQEYNDELDRMLLKFLRIGEGMIMTFSEFIELLEINLENIVPLCTHPGESMTSRREGLIRGITIIRKSQA